jgi:ribosomal protein L20
MAKLKKNGFALDRKVLAEFAADHPEIFARISKQVV